MHHLIHRMIQVVSLLQVSIKRRGSISTFNVARKYKRLVMSTRYKKSPYTARVMLNCQSTLRQTTISEVNQSVRQEIQRICARTEEGDSILRSISNVNSLTHFSWKSILAELKMHTPTLYTLLRGALMKRRDSHLQVPYHALGMTACVLLKHRNKHMSLTQALVSVLMYAGHCSKQVCNLTYIYNYIISVH